MSNNNNNCNISITNAYVIDNSSSKVIWRNHKQGRQKASLEHGSAEKLWWKRDFKETCFEFLRKVAVVSEDLFVVWEWCFFTSIQIQNWPDANKSELPSVIETLNVTLNLIITLKLTVNLIICVHPISHKRAFARGGVAKRYHLFRQDTSPFTSGS